MTSIEPHTEWTLGEEGWKVGRLAAWLRQLRRAVYDRRVGLSAEYARCGSPLDFGSRLGLEYRPAAVGEVWGAAWDHAWFRLRGEVPRAWAGSRVVALVNLGGEATVFSPSGDPAGRLTNGSVFDVWYEVDEIPLFEACAGGEAVDFWVQAWASKLDGVTRPEDPGRDEPGRDGRHDARVTTLEMARVDTATLGLFHDVEVLLSALACREEHSLERGRLLDRLMRALFAWKDDALNSAASRAILAGAFEEIPQGIEAVVTGHAHIDTGWLWRVRDSISKCGRTFAAQAANLDANPGFVFGASSAQHYAFVAEHFPGLHRRIREFVREGRWEVQSGMWVESDVNLPSGESLVRQFLYGHAFIRREFGVGCRIAWLPDVFGLTAALPQILAQSGVSYLLTKKPHWSRRTVFPHTAFRWHGHDGSSVLVHILPQARDYNGQARPEDLRDAVRGFLEKDRLDTFLYTMGVGDGGGGPSQPMIERVRRMRGIGGLPRVRFGTALEVFQKIEASSGSLPEWHGEIYVEGHRGTYTSQARLKEANRRAEVLLGQIEHLFCHLDPSEYPRGEITSCWHKVLLNQFHDILPGSCIREVAEDALEDYKNVFATVAELKGRFGQHLPAEGSAVSYFNSLATTWTGCVETPGTVLSRGGSTPVPTQREPDGTTVALIAIPPLSFAQFSKAAAAVTPAGPLDAPVLENAFLRCRFDETGRIVSCTDKGSGAEFFPGACLGNRLSLYIDRPIDWDAWDIDHFYMREKVGEAEPDGPWRGWAGPARSVIEFPLKLGASRMLLRCSLDAGSRRVDFDLSVDWRERHRMLRCGFDTGIECPAVRCGIQHGFLTRPTHALTPQDRAKFEVPFHGFVALATPDSGLALLANGKYGLRIEERFLEIALLRGPTFPDHSADEGRHRITYAFLPFGGDRHFGDVQSQSDIVAFKPLEFPNRTSSHLSPLFDLKAAGVRVEAVKRAESGGEIIVRLANVGGTDARCSLRSAAGAVHRSGLDEAVGPAISEGEGLRLRPFELATFALSPSTQAAPLPDEGASATRSIHA